MQLDGAEDSAVVVEEVLPAPKFLISSRKINCIFKIDARKYNQGLFAVIRRLNFRKTPHNKCLDYIRFTYSNDKESEKICGNITSSTLLSLKDGGGKLKIEINIDTSEPLESSKDIVEFSLVFTGFGPCKNDRIQCYPDDNTTCISNHFWRDGVQNCPYPCHDEGSCEDIKMDPMFQPSDIILSAITSLIFTMVIFGTCIWLCWKYREYNDIQRQDHNRHRRRRSGNFEMQSSVETASSPEHSGNTVPIHAIPTAPPASHAPSMEKEDMPPSYSDLFPER